MSPRFFGGDRNSPSQRQSFALSDQSSAPGSSDSRRGGPVPHSFAVQPNSSQVHSGPQPLMSWPVRRVPPKPSESHPFAEPNTSQVHSGPQPLMSWPVRRVPPKPSESHPFAEQPNTSQVHSGPQPLMSWPFRRVLPKPSDDPFAEQPNTTTQVNPGPQPLMSWPAQIPAQPSDHYVRMLKQELTFSRSKNQEYETAIANFVSQTFLIRNHNQGAPYPSHGTSGLQLVPTVPLTGTTYLPPPSRLSSQPHLMSRPFNPTTVPISYGLPSSELIKRQRDWTDRGDRASEFANKKARHSFMPSTASSRHNSVTAVASHSTSTSFTSTSSHSNEPDWSIEYNPEVDRTFDVNLVRTITDQGEGCHIEFSPNGQLLAVVPSESQVVTIYNVATGVKICQLEDLYVRQEDFLFQDLSFSPNGKYLATCTLPGSIIRIWEVGKKYVRNILNPHLIHPGPNRIFCLKFSPDGRHLVSGLFDGKVRIWNQRDGSSRVFHNSDTGIWSACFSPDGRQIAAGNSIGDVLIWEMRSGHLVASWKGHTNVLNGIAFMPNGEGLISGSWDKTMRYWDISGSKLSQMSDEKGHAAGDAEKKESLTFVGHTSRIRSISISPDGQWLASGSDDNTGRIWNIRTGTQQCILQLDSWVSIHFSPEGGYLASGEWDGTVRLWSYKPS